MNLEEAERLKNNLCDLMSRAASYLSKQDNLVTVTEIHYRSSVDPAQEDKTYDLSKKDAASYTPMSVIAVWKLLHGEHKRLCRAIAAAKSTLEDDFVALVEENRRLERFTDSLECMLQQFSTSQLRPAAGTAHLVNWENEVAEFAYDIEYVTQPDYDHEPVRALLTELAREMAANRRVIDAPRIKATVDFEPHLPLDVALLCRTNPDPNIADWIHDGDGIFGALVHAVEENAA